MNEGLAVTLWYARQPVLGELVISSDRVDEDAVLGFGVEKFEREIRNKPTPRTGRPRFSV